MWLGKRRPGPSSPAPPQARPGPPYFPVQRGNVKVSNLQVLNAILYVLEHGCKWRGLPEKFGNWHTVCMWCSTFLGLAICESAVGPEGTVVVSGEETLGVGQPYLGHVLVAADVGERGVARRDDGGGNE